MDHLPYRKLLQQNGYTLRDLAEAAGVSTATASRWLIWLTDRGEYGGIAPPIVRLIPVIEMCATDEVSRNQIWAHICTGHRDGHLPSKDARDEVARNKIWANICTGHPDGHLPEKAARDEN